MVTVNPDKTGTKTTPESSSSSAPDDKLRAASQKARDRLPPGDTGDSTPSPDSPVKRPRGRPRKSATASEEKEFFSNALASTLVETVDNALLVFSGERPPEKKTFGLNPSEKSRLQSQVAAVFNESRVSKVLDKFGPLPVLGLTVSQILLSRYLMVREAQKKAKTKNDNKSGSLPDGSRSGGERKDIPASVPARSGTS